MTVVTRTVRVMMTTTEMGMATTLGPGLARVFCPTAMTVMRQFTPGSTMAAAVGMKTVTVSWMKTARRLSIPGLRTTQGRWTAIPNRTQEHRPMRPRTPVVPPPPTPVKQTQKRRILALFLTPEAPQVPVQPVPQAVVDQGRAGIAVANRAI